RPYRTHCGHLLLLKNFALTAEPAKFLLFGGGQPVRTKSLIASCLRRPVGDGRSRSSHFSASSLWARPMRTNQTICSRTVSGPPRRRHCSSHPSSSSGAMLEWPHEPASRIFHTLLPRTAT